MNIPVTELRPGDIITTDADDIDVHHIEIIGDGGLPGQGATVRVHGNISRGTGRSGKIHTWTHHADQTVDVHRPGSGEQVWHFTPGGKARRVR